MFSIRVLRNLSVLPCFLLLFCSGSLVAQCPISLGCNDNIQISLGFDCNAVITPALILEDEKDNCDYRVTIKSEDDRVLAETVDMGGTLVFPSVDGSYIGAPYKAEVFFVNDNNTTISCWGFITVEDKLPPVISCIEDFTVNCNEDLSDLYTASTTATYESTGPDLDTDSTTVTVAMCNTNPGANTPSPFEIIESATLSFMGLTTGSGSADINGVPVDFSIVGTAIEGDLIGTQVDTSTCIIFTYPASTIPAGGITTTISSVSFFEYQIVDNCDPNLDVLVTFDETQNLDCVDDITAERTIRYYTQDDVGLSADFCEFTISFLKKSLSDVVFPPSIDIDCEDAPMTAGELDLSPAETGFPLLDGNIIMDEDNLCRINVTFSDDTFNICGVNTIKILRRWTALDWCEGQYAQSYQTIKVIDETPPVITCPPDDMVFLADNDCTASIIFKPFDSSDRTGAMLLDDCSALTVQVEFLRGDQRDPDDINQPFNPAVSIGNNMFRADGLQSGRNWIKYIATDACGLSAECRFEIIVADDDAPIPVCDQYTVVSLDNSGWGRVFPLSIDDGSYDRCGGPVNLEIKRSDSVCMGQTSDRNFGEFVSFCCEEAGDTIMVQLLVTDDGGRSNTCEVSVVVQDKSGFNITCPSRLNIDLDCSEINNIGIATYGTAVISDDCGAGVISFDDDEDFDDQCGTGTVVRTFSLSLNGSVVPLTQCTQTFNFSSDIALTQNSFVFPADREDATCENYTTDLGDAPTYRGIAVNEAAFCGDLTYSYNDLVFEQVEGFCIKVIRTWTVIDWCTHNANGNSDIGKWSDIQIIKVSQSAGPQFNNCPEDVTVDINDSTCLGTVGFNAPTAMDLCKNEPVDSDEITYALTGPNGFSRSGSGDVPTIALGPGTYNVVWTAVGICGDDNSCTHTITVRDLKSPTPYCLGGVTTVLMVSNDPTVEPMVEIWANDFDLGSSDNCGDVEISFSSDPNDKSKAFTCDDLGMTLLEIWVTDGSGNQDFCTTTIDIQANGDICAMTGTGTRIAGNVGTALSEMIEEVEVELQNMTDNSITTDMTNVNGEFAFSNNLLSKDYNVSVRSQDDYLNGVSTLDLLIIQRHILGARPLVSPYEVVAADIDNSQSITALDLIELRKLILGIYDELPNNDSWRFVDRKQTFNDVQSPWPLDEQITIYNLDNSMMGNNFVAIKIGDINGTVQVNATDTEIESRSNKSESMSIEILELSKGTYLVPVYLDNPQSVQGLQLELDLNTQIEVADIESGKLKLNATNFNVTDGNVKMIWHDSQVVNIRRDEALFYLTIKADVQLHESMISMSSNNLKSELYNDLDEVISLSLGSISHDVSNRLYQNTPNPFNRSTSIQFELSQASDVLLNIYDTNGQLIKTIKGNYNKGASTIDISPDDLSGSGIYYYQMTAGSYKASKKMIFIE